MTRTYRKSIGSISMHVLKTAALSGSTIPCSWSGARPPPLWTVSSNGTDPLSGFCRSRLFDKYFARLPGARLSHRRLGSRRKIETRAGKTPGPHLGHPDHYALTTAPVVCRVQVRQNEVFEQSELRLRTRACLVNARPVRAALGPDGQVQ